MSMTLMKTQETATETAMTKMPSAKTGRDTVSVIIPIMNVEPIIARCLDQLKWADDVILVDMFSTDRTREICEAYPNVRFNERKDYIYGNVNFGLQQATTDWVIRLDSDEVLNGELQRNIVAFLEKPDPEVNTILFPSVQYMFGFPMHHGVGLPELVARRCMFRRGTAYYECKSEHEDIISQGPTKTLSGYYEHFTNHTTEDVIRKFNYYTDKDVERLPVSELRPPQPGKILYRAFRTFILFYCQQKGYKDGYLGFFSSLFRGCIYGFIEEAKRWEAWERHRTEKK